MTFEALPDRTLVRTRGGSRRYVKMLVEAPDALDERPRPPVNLAVVIDRSGSMGGQKIEHAREAALHTVRSLGDGDRLSLVAYDDRIEVLLPSVSVDTASRREAERAISRLDARGSTNLCEGWLRGCEQVGAHLSTERVGRALLMSDGLANRGIVDRNEIVAHATALRDRGVSTSTFGIGAGFDEDLLARMAECGGGNFYYVETAEQIPDFVASEVGESLDVVARDAAVVVHVPRGATVRSPNGYPVSHDGDRWRVSLGALVSRQLLEPALEIRFPEGAGGDTATVTLSLDDADGVLDASVIDLGYRYADDRDNDQQSRDVEVDRHIARLFAASTRREALQLNRQGRYDDARGAMLATARRTAEYAGEDPELNEVLAEIRRAAEQYRHRMSDSFRKGIYSASYYATRTRSAVGKSMRSVSGSGLVLLPLLPAIEALVTDVVGRTRPALTALFPYVHVSDRLTGHFDAQERSEETLSASSEWRLVEAAVRAAPGPGVRIVSTGRQLGDNWFSHWYAPQSTAVSSLFGWDETASVAREAFIACEILLYGLHSLSPRYDLLAVAHVDTRGCVFDLCGLRADIEIKLQTMDLCGPCEHELRRLRVDLHAVKGICEAVRELARPVPPPARKSGEKRAGV